MGIYDAWLDFRDKCLTSHKFHKFALQFPLTRPVVRKRQNELFDIVSGFVYSQILYSCVKLNVFSCPQVLEGGADIAALSAYTGLGFDETRRLAKGAAALRLLEERNQRFRLGDLGAALSVNEGALAMVLHHQAFYKDLCDPVQMLQSGRGETHLSRYWDYARNADPASAQKEDVSAYTKLMSASQHMVSEEVIAAVDFKKFHKVMDVGGGQGTFLTNVGSAFAHLELMLFDLPEVAELAKTATVGSPVFNRLTFHGGSFFDDDLPAGCDLVTLVRILHDHDDAQVMQILSAVHNCLQPGHSVMVCEPMSSGGSAQRISDAYFNFYLYAMGSGRPRTPDEITQMLEMAGFRNIAQIPTRAPFTTSIICAQK